MAAAEHAIFARRPTPYPSSPAKYCSHSTSLPAGKSPSISGSCVCGRDCRDRISFLGDKLLSNIVGRLPVKDAARTTILSPLWRSIWASTPLVLDDADLLPAPKDAVADAVSWILNSHPGPFRFVRLTDSCEYAAGRDGGSLLRKWIGVLADKGVGDLVLFNRSRPIPADLPADVLRLSSLSRLDLANWDFPSTDNLTRHAFFSNLRELGLCQTDIRAEDLDRIIRFSPNLDRLALVDDSPPGVLIRSYRLRCGLFWRTAAQEVHVLAAPMLERLILWKCTGAPLWLRIGHAPNLEVLGYLDPRWHMLELCGTVVEVPSARPLPMVPSVKVLALKIRISVAEEANMVPVYLRCFPNVQTLHIMFDEVDESSVKLKTDFRSWQEVGRIHCMLSTMKMVVLKNFRGDDLEFEFFTFLWESAKVLKKVVLVFANDLETVGEVVSRVKSVWAKRCGCKARIVMRTGGTKWSFHIASDLSLSDPFNF